MNEAMVCIAAVGFALALFPIHLYNYIFINTEKKYAALNVCVFRFLRFFNANTVEDKPGVMQINGKDKKINFKKVKLNAYKIFNSLCFYKVVQLGDFGIAEQKNAYAALAQTSLSTAIYKFIQINGSNAKLKNYTILNEEHNYIRYYCKAVTIVNLLVIGKILLILLTEKLHAHKN